MGLTIRESTGITREQAVAEHARQFARPQPTVIRGGVRDKILQATEARETAQIKAAQQSASTY